MGARRRTAAAAPAHAAGSLGHLLEGLDRDCLAGGEALRWPPDVFGLCAYLLKLSGSYVEVLKEWPPRAGRNDGSSWCDWVVEVASRWRRISTGAGAVPSEVRERWAIVRQAARLPLANLSTKPDVVRAVLELVALSDQASEGAGIPLSSVPDRFDRRAKELLADVEAPGLGSTLSARLPRALVRVLPKQHSPRGGLTLRSLTHHLALHVGDEVTPYWYAFPRATERRALNVLLAPWPLSLRPNQFHACDGKLAEMPERFGFVEVELESDVRRVRTWTSKLIEEAKRLSGRVDVIVFPEASLTSAEYETVKKLALSDGVFLIAGVQRRASEGGASENVVVIDAVEGGVPMHVEQRKHHRWRLDRPQIEMYGLGGTLDPTRDWWEHIELGPRRVNFVALDDRTSLCCLVCEDLARQDPVAELVRAVGPNLVVALLMDAPQLGVRWPARYATVLAEDPGSSVLTLTSLGMIELARAPKHARPSRSIALWKDARSELVELELPAGAQGLLLSLCSEQLEEWSADARSDGGVTSYPRLGAVHPVRF